MEELKLPGPGGFKIDRLLSDFRQAREGTRTPFTARQVAQRKTRNKMAKASRRANRAR